VQLSDGQRETLVALTSRYARFTDLLFQRLFRTLDQLELIDEGSHIDRLNRMEKRGIFTSANLWQNLRQLRNDIVHEYLIEASDYVVTESLKVSQEVLETLKRLENYIQAKGY
jgi:uncharacterized protein YutE (UPF0331/DUF86 family)